MPPPTPPFTPPFIALCFTSLDFIQISPSTSAVYDISDESILYIYIQKKQKSSPSTYEVNFLWTNFDSFWAHGHSPLNSVIICGQFA